MRRLSLICFALILSVAALAQQTISRDTINIHGYIYEDGGKPVNFMYVQSTQNELEHNTFKLGAFTNERGYFELKGARLNDTLTLGPDINYNLKPIYNRGSRMIVVYLPVPKTVDVTAGGPVVISAKRQSPKVVATFKVTPTENKAKDADRQEAKYPGGKDALMNFIRQNIQYPLSAIKANVEGEVEVLFTVTKEGSHKNFKVMRGLTNECDEQVLQALRKSANWEPAYNNGQAVAMQESVTVQFKLTD
jgi:TonB family protein